MKDATVDSPIADLGQVMESGDGNDEVATVYDKTAI